MRKQVYNIAHVLPWSSVGGVEQATLRIAQAVEADGFRSTAFCLPDSSLVSDLFASSNFETGVYEGVLPSYRHPVAHLRASLRLAREFKRRRIDLVHCADVLSGFYAATAGRIAGLPVLCHVRVREAELSRRDQSFLRLVHKFAFVSQDTWKRFAYRVPPERGTVVYDGIDVVDEERDEAMRGEVRAEFRIPDGCKVVGMVARVAPQKDYGTLVRAAARVVAVNPNVRFLIVGDHSTTPQYRRHYDEVRAMLAANNVERFFVFTDFRTDVRRMLSALDIFVLSTHCEGLPLVILEAMAQALPVIATGVDGIPEIVLHEKTGLLHGHEDDAGLADHLLTLLRDEDGARRLGASARAHVKRDFSREQFAASMSDLYGEMLSRPSSVTAGDLRSSTPEVEKSRDQQYQD